MCQMFCLQDSATLWDDIGCGYWILTKDGPDSNNFPVLLTAVKCRKEAATPTYTEKNFCVP